MPTHDRAGEVGRAAASVLPRTSTISSSSSSTTTPPTTPRGPRPAGGAGPPRPCGAHRRDRGPLRGPQPRPGGGPGRARGVLRRRRRLVPRRRRRDHRLPRAAPRRGGGVVVARRAPRRQRRRRGVPGPARVRARPVPVAELRGASLRGVAARRTELRRQLRPRPAHGRGLGPVAALRPGRRGAHRAARRVPLHPTRGEPGDAHRRRARSSGRRNFVAKHGAEMSGCVPALPRDGARRIRARAAPRMARRLAPGAGAVPARQRHRRCARCAIQLRRSPSRAAAPGPGAPVAPHGVDVGARGRRRLRPWHGARYRLRGSWERGDDAWQRGRVRTAGPTPCAFSVRPGPRRDASAVASLHARLIAEGFLSSLGPRFLTRLYRRITRARRAPS